MLLPVTIFGLWILKESLELAMKFNDFILKALQETVSGLDSTYHETEILYAKPTTSNQALSVDQI